MPVKALLARQGGGYALELAGGGMVSVTPGLYADDMVEVEGSGLREGQQVVTRAVTAVLAPRATCARPIPAASRRCAACRCAWQDGEAVAVIGPSGSGKSTLLHVMGTLERPSGGSVRVAGEDTAALGERALAALRARSIGFVFQQFFLLDGHERARQRRDWAALHGRGARPSGARRRARRWARSGSSTG